MTAISNKAGATNAIALIQFAMALSEPVDAAGMQKVRDATASFAELMPGERQGPPPNTVSIVFNAGGPQYGVPQEFTRFRTAADGKLEWQLNVAANVIRVECRQYTRFNEVWGIARAMLLACLTSLNRPLLVTELTMQIIDQFNYPVGMPIDQYRMDELFRPDSPYLTQKAWSSGHLWHVFQGWFEPGDQYTHILNQLNVSTAANIPQNMTASIDHNQSFRSTQPVPIDLGPMLQADPNGGATAFDQIFSTMHDQNKRIIRELLNDAKLADIGFYGAAT